MTSHSFRAIFLATLTFFLLNSSLHVFAASVATEALAADIEEVIVSDFRRTQSRELPSSLSVMDAQLIEDITVQHFEELSHLVPNLNLAGGASRPRYFQIRGIGERSQYEGAPNPSVGFVVDDMDFSALGGIATMFDVEQVEVLRGPQGTRYGANALAGLIYIQYQKPTEEFDARFTATLGNDETHTLGTAFGGPINDVLNYRAVLHKNTGNGFRNNAFLKRDDTNARDETTTRLKFNYAINDNWNADLGLMHVDIANGYDAFAVDNSFTTQSNRPGQDSQLSKAAVLKIKGNINNSVNIESITSAARSDVIFSFDADWGNNDFWAPVVYDYFSSTERDRQNLSQEFRLLSQPGTGLFNDRVDWVMGTIFSNNKESNHTVDDGNFEGFTSLESISREYEASTFAVFADVNTIINERITLNSGLRFEKRNSDYFDSSGERFNPSENNLGGQLALNYMLSDSTNMYAKIARGYKAGGFNLGLPAEAQNSTLLYDAEYLWNYEVGLKSSYFDDRLSLNAIAFYMQRRDQQVQTSTQLVPNDPSTFIFFTDNAGKGKNSGFEIETKIDLNDAFNLYANLGLLKTEINNFEGASNGREQAHAPNYTYALGGRYNFNNNWFARVDLSGKDEFYFSDSHDQVSQAYTLVNARLGYARDNWSVSLWGKNLANEEYAVRGFYFGNEPAKGFADTLYLRLGDPRQFGVSFDYQY